MVELHNLDSFGATRGKMRVGRGDGSKKGKTCGKGHKGAKARSGYKTRAGQEGGQLPLHRKVPFRGFTNARFKKDVYSVSTTRLETAFEDGEEVSRETLVLKGFISSKCTSLIKIIGGKDITKKLSFNVDQMTKSVQALCDEKKLSYTLAQKK